MQIKGNEENIFEKKAQTILKYLKSNLRYDEKYLPRPFFIELTGSPSSGKTTTNPKTVETLVRRYKNAYDILSPQYPKLHLIDTTMMNEQEMVKNIAIKTLQILEQKSKTAAK